MQTGQIDVCSWTISRLARAWYGPLLEKTCSKVLITLGFVALLIFAIVGSIRVTDGLEVTDVVPRDTDEYRFLEAQAEYFGFYIFYAVTKVCLQFLRF
jgi:patched 1 protein